MVSQDNNNSVNFCPIKRVWLGAWTSFLIQGSLSERHQKNLVYRSPNSNQPKSFHQIPSQTTPLSGRTGLVTRVVEDTLIHQSISFINIPPDLIFPSDDITEHLSIIATINNIPVNNHNIYIPPTSSCPSNFTPNSPSF